DDLLLPHRPARSARLRRPLDSSLHDDPRVSRPLLSGTSPRRRDRRNLLAFRRRHVDRRLLDRLPDLMVWPASSGGARPAITRRPCPPSPLPRQSASAAAECVHWLGASDPTIYQQDRPDHP